MYEWHILVKRRNLYGDKYVEIVHAHILAESQSQVTEKVRAAFNSTWDGFRKFWSHDWELISMKEVKE